MSSVIGREELAFALTLPKHVVAKIIDYEKKTWAANITDPKINSDWREFLRKLESILKQKNVNEKPFIELTRFLSTVDTIMLIERIGVLSSERQERFLYLLNWVAEKSINKQAKVDAIQVRERILMTYRLVKYPQVYSVERLDRAIKVLTNS